MKINHIYITKEREPMANPEMEYPIRGKSCEYSDCKCEIGDPCEAEKKYHSGLLPFEDITLFKAATWGNGPFVFLPSTLIPVDIEVEVVKQCRRIDLVPAALWIDGSTQIPMPNYEYRTVLRIKP